MSASIFYSIPQYTWQYFAGMEHLLTTVACTRLRSQCAAVLSAPMKRSKGKKEEKKNQAKLQLGLTRFLIAAYPPDVPVVFC
jgi:hypothetical protein